MLPALLITLRETLEAALIVGIVLSYLARTRQTRYNAVVYVGVAAGVVASALSAFLFERIAGGFTGQAEQLFEGITMLAGAALLTTMILWMMRQNRVAAELEQRVATELSEAHRFGLFALIFVAVLREGIETVIFLGAAVFVSGDNSLVGALLGIVLAVALGYAIFVGSLRINLRKFFAVTNVLLILFAAGLVAHGVHELQEAGAIPIVVEHVWDINPPAGAEGPYPLLHENGALGSILKGLFGYNGNPSLIEVASYMLYLLAAGVAWTKAGRQRARDISASAEEAPAGEAHARGDLR